MLGGRESAAALLAIKVSDIPITRHLMFRSMSEAPLSFLAFGFIPASFSEMDAVFGSQQISMSGCRVTHVIE